MSHEVPPLSEHIAELIQLSAIYFDDGAPRTAANKLREAADLLDAEADQREAIFRGDAR